jgi:hypothetical protein
MSNIRLGKLSAPSVRDATTQRFTTGAIALEADGSTAVMERELLPQWRDMSHMNKP